MFGRGIILVLAIGILFLGCCGPTGGGATGETGGTGGTGTGGAGTGGTGVNGGENGGTGGAGTDGEAGGTGGETGGGTGGTGGEQGGGGQGGGNDLAGLGYEQLIGLGIPLECDISTTYEGETTYMKVYMKNENELRNEVPLEEQGAMCDKVILIRKGDTLYNGCEGQKYPPGTSCDWVKFVMDQSEPGGPSTEPPDYSDVPSEQINCVPWVVDESKFATPGKVCTMEDIQNEMMNQYNQ